MLLRPGQRRDHGFDEPLGLPADCRRRIEHFLEVLTADELDEIGREMAARRSLLPPKTP